MLQVGGFNEGNVARITYPRRLTFQDLLQFQIAYLCRGILSSAIRRHAFVHTIFRRLSGIVAVFQNFVVRFRNSIAHAYFGLRLHFFFRVFLFLLSQLTDDRATGRCDWWCGGVSFRFIFCLVWIYGCAGVERGRLPLPAWGEWGTGTVASVLVMRSSVACNVVLGA